MFPEWHHAVPESAYFKVPETLKTFRMYPISRFVYVLHWLATRLYRYFILEKICSQQFGYDVLNTRNVFMKIPRREGDVAEEGQWRRVVELRLQFIIAL